MKNKLGILVALSAAILWRRQRQPTRRTSDQAGAHHHAVPGRQRPRRRGAPPGRQAQPRWGKPVTVENRPGGNGFIAIDAFKRGATDGHDLIQLDNVHLVAYPHLFKKLPYDAAKDFEQIDPLFKTNFFFTVAVTASTSRSARSWPTPRPTPAS
jgi:hypothetical protein